MGQRANSNRGASLDDKKIRMAGRQQDRGPTKEAISDFQKPLPEKGKTGGAFGKDARANRKGGAFTRGAGGGGGAPSQPKDNNLTTGRSSRPARKQNA